MEIILMRIIIIKCNAKITRGSLAFSPCGTDGVLVLTERLCTRNRKTIAKPFPEGMSFESERVLRFKDRISRTGRWSLAVTNRLLGEPK